MLCGRPLTPPCGLQHYVRNHGAVPRLGWDHRFSVGGLVERPQDFSVSDLIKALPTFTLPVTLVCAGNRRREQVGLPPPPPAALPVEHAELGLGAGQAEARQALA